MGHSVDPDHFKLVFPDERFARPTDGDPVEIVMEELSIGELLDFDELRLTPVETFAESKTRQEQISAFIAEHLVGWNLERKGEPLPLSAAGVSKLPSRLYSALIVAWVNANTGISAPLETGSPSGGPFPEDAIPMEPLSPSPES